MTPPSSRECYVMLRDMQVPQHVVAHSIQVCRVATLITSRLLDAGVALDQELVRAASLLHDITKIRSMGTGELHSRTGEKYLADKGYDRVGLVVGQHVRLASYFASDVPDEAEVVNYSDKRVSHDRIVSLEERLDDIMTRYGTDEPRRARIASLVVDTRRVEARIFALVDMDPAEISDLLPDAGLEADLVVYRSLCA